MDVRPWKSAIDSLRGIKPAEVHIDITPTRWERIKWWSLFCSRCGRVQSGEEPFQLTDLDVVCHPERYAHTWLLSGLSGPQSQVPADSQPCTCGDVKWPWTGITGRCGWGNGERFSPHNVKLIEVKAREVMANYSSMGTATYFNPMANTASWNMHYPSAVDQKFDNKVEPWPAQYHLL